MSKVVRPAVTLLSSICLAAILFAGCQEQKEKPVETGKSVEAGKAAEPAEPVEAGKPAPPASPAHEVSILPPGHPALAPRQDLKSLPRVSLAEINVQESEDGSVTRITIAGGGTFASNVIRKEDPDRIILLIHNAEAGELAGSIEVNNGTVGRIEVAQIESGQGPAVRVTIGLTENTEYRVVPADKELVVDVRQGP